MRKNTIKRVYTSRFVFPCLLNICLKTCLSNLFELSEDKSSSQVKNYAFVKFRDASRRITVVRYVTDLGGEISLAVNCVVHSCLSHQMKHTNFMTFQNACFSPKNVASLHVKTSSLIFFFVFV